MVHVRPPFAWGPSCPAWACRLGALSPNPTLHPLTQPHPAAIHLVPALSFLLPCQVLLYLWRVHGIDYYAGREFNNPAERGRGAARRTLRGARPSEEELAAAAEDEAATADAAGKAEAAEAKPSEKAEAAAEVEQQGEQQAEASQQEQQGGEPAASPPAKDAGEQQQGAGKEAAAQQQQPQQGRDGKQLQGGSEAAKEYEHRVTGFWRYRIDRGDPLEVPLQRKRVRAPPAPSAAVLHALAGTVWGLSERRSLQQLALFAGKGPQGAAAAAGPGPRAGYAPCRDARLLPSPALAALPPAPCAAG